MTVVLLHGFLGRPSSWDEIYDGLRLDLPGHGPSPWTGADTFDNALGHLLEQMPPRSIVAGYSMGARIALRMALLHPERIAGALLVAPDPGAGDPTARAQWDEDEARAIEALGVERYVERWERLPLFASQTTLPEVVLAAQRRSRREHTARGLAWAMRTLGLGAMPSGWEALPSCQVPLRFLAGSLDTKFVERCRKAAHLAPRAVFSEVEGAGHNLLLERPDRVAAELRQLIQ